MKSSAQFAIWVLLAPAFATLQAGLAFHEGGFSLHEIPGWIVVYGVAWFIAALGISELVLAKRITSWSELFIWIPIIVFGIFWLTMIWPGPLVILGYPLTAALSATVGHEMRWKWSAKTAPLGDDNER